MFLVGPHVVPTLPYSNAFTSLLLLLRFACLQFVLRLLDKVLFGGARTGESVLSMLGSLNPMATPRNAQERRASLDRSGRVRLASFDRSSGEDSSGDEKVCVHVAMWLRGPWAVEMQSSLSACMPTTSMPLRFSCPSFPLPFPFHLQEPKQIRVTKRTTSGTAPTTFSGSMHKRLHMAKWGVRFFQLEVCVSLSLLTCCRFLLHVSHPHFVLSCAACLTMCVGAPPPSPAEWCAVVLLGRA
jgi:hypothetical protein